MPNTNRPWSASGGKVLIISYLFPPIGGGGVIRVTKFVKFLPQFGWKPFVVTVKKGFYQVKDESLLDEIPDEAVIERVDYFEPGFWFNSRFWQSVLSYFIYPLFLIPDQQILWLLPAVQRARKIIKEEKIKIILTTSSPTSDHLIGFILKKITRAKWIADFRDEWANNPLKKYPTPLHRYLDRFLEKIVVKNADEIVTVSKPITEYIQKIAVSEKKVSTITNGFDEDDFQGLQPSKDKMFNLVYVGSLYNLGYQENLIRAFEDLNLKNARLTFLGTKKRLAHKQAVKKMLAADVLLLILDPVQRPGVLTGKLFEYLRAKKPIIALAYQNSEAAKMIRKLKAGEVAEPNPLAFQKTVIKMYQKWQKNELKVPLINLEKFKRKNLTRNLVKIFEKMIKNHQKRMRLKLCLIGNIQSSQNQSLCQYFVQKGYEIHFISTKPGKISKVKTYYLPSSRHTACSTACYFLKSLYKIRRIIKQIKPDIIHGQDLVFAGIWAYLSGFKPFVVTPWGSDVMNYEKFIGSEKYLIRKTLKGADLVTGTSLAIKNQSIRLGARPEKFQLVHFGIDLKVFEGGKKDKKPIIFCPRAIAPVYNTEILIKAYYEIIKRNPRIELALLENGADENYLLEIEKLIIRLDLVDKVQFWRKVPNKKMAAYYNKAEVVVSISSSDGCSVSFLEAMAMEKKIVATKLPYIKEWVFNKTKGRNLWLVSVRDVQATAKAIFAAWEYPASKWQKIGRANRQMIAQKAEIKDNFGKLDKLYKDLI